MTINSSRFLKFKTFYLIIFCLLSFVFSQKLLSQENNVNGYWKFDNVKEVKRDTFATNYYSELKMTTSTSLPYTYWNYYYQTFRLYNNKKEDIKESVVKCRSKWTNFPDYMIPWKTYNVTFETEILEPERYKEPIWITGNCYWLTVLETYILTVPLSSLNINPCCMGEIYEKNQFDLLYNLNFSFRGDDPSLYGGMLKYKRRVNNFNTPYEIIYEEIIDFVYIDKQLKRTEDIFIIPAPYSNKLQEYGILIVLGDVYGGYNYFLYSYKWVTGSPEEPSETIVNLYNQGTSPVYTSPGDKNTCKLQADVDCSDPQEKAGRTVRIEFANQQIGSFNTTEAVTDAKGQAYFTYTAPDESVLQGKDNIKVEVKAVDVKSGKETYLVPIEVYKRDSKSTFAAAHIIMPQGSKYYNEIKLSINAPPKGTGYSATISTKDAPGLITTSKTDPNGSSPVVDNLVPGKVYTLYYHNTGSTPLSAPIEDEITLDVPELGIKKTINVSVGMDLSVQTVERKYKTGAVLPAVPEPVVIDVVDNFHPGADLEKIFDDFEVKMRVRITPTNVSQTSVLSKVQEDWISRALTRFEGFMFGGDIVTTSGDAVVTVKKSPDGKYTVCKSEREAYPFVMMFERGTYDFQVELIDFGFPDNQSNNTGSISMTVDEYKNEADEFLKTAMIPMAKNMIDILTGGLMKYGDFAAATSDLVLYKDAVKEGKLQDALMLLFGMYCDKLGNTKEFYNVVTKEVKPLSETTKRLLELNNLSSNALDLTKLIVAEAPNKGGGVSSPLKDISSELKYSQLITKGMKDYYFIIMDKSGLKNYSATLKTGGKLLPSADKILNSKSADERIESGNDYIVIPFQNSETASLSLDFSGSGGFLYRVTKDNIDKVEFPKNSSSVKLDISSSGALSLGKQEAKKEEPKTSLFSGSWETADFGTVSFIIAGNDVVATCTKNLAGMKGKLSSDGTKITGTWAKFPTYSSPNDAGKFEITVSSDGKSFTGSWSKGTDSNSKLDKPLNGKKK